MERSKLIILVVIGFFVLVFFAYQFDSCGENEGKRAIKEKHEQEERAIKEREEQKRILREKEDKIEERENKIRKMTSQIEGVLRTDWIYPKATMTGTIEFQKDYSAPVFKFHITTVDFVARDGKIHAVCKDDGKCIQYKNEQLGDYELKEISICGASDEILILFNDFKKLVGQSMTEQ
jgi:hypothetical protein